MKSAKYRCPVATAGFSLMEVLVGVSILAVVAVGVGKFVKDSLQSNVRAIGKVARAGEESRVIAKLRPLLKQALKDDPCFSSRSLASVIAGGDLVIETFRDTAKLPRLAKHEVWKKVRAQCAGKGVLCVRSPDVDGALKRNNGFTVTEIAVKPWNISANRPFSASACAVESKEDSFAYRLSYLSHTVYDDGVQVQSVDRSASQLVFKDKEMPAINGGGMAEGDFVMSCEYMELGATRCVFPPPPKPGDTEPYVRAFKYSVVKVGNAETYVAVPKDCPLSSTCKVAYNETVCEMDATASRDPRCAIQWKDSNRFCMGKPRC